MLAVALRLLILFELTCYATLALRFFDASPLAAGLFALAGVLALRLWVVVLIYLLGRTHGSSAPPLSRARAVAMMIAEYAAFVANFVLISPFERWVMGEDRLSPGAVPVLLIHGYGCSRAAWWWQRRRLEAAGWCVATINLEPIYTSIENYVDLLARRIDQVLDATGAQRLVLVGHSMGGLVARAYLRRYGASKVSRLVTLGTPHGGSELAKVGCGENARQMRPGNPWLTTLAGEAPIVDALTVYSPHDNYVLPRANLDWPGARRLTIDGLGHLAMLFSPRVATALLDALAAPDKGEAA